MKNEAVLALLKNFSEDTGMDIHFFGTGNSARYFADFLQNGTFYAGDAPDLMLKKENDIIIVEHFEFDSYSVCRKGSSGRQELARIQRKESEKNDYYFSDEIKAENSFHNLITNLCNSFTRHYSRISVYKENLKNCGLIDDLTKVKVMFLVEDVSPLGSMVVDNNAKVRPIIVLLCKEFLDLFSASVDLNYVLACSSAGDKDFVWFADREEVEEYYKNAVDYEKMYFLPSNVQVFGLGTTV